MASRRTSTMPKSLKTTTTESKGSKGGNAANKANNSGNEKKSVKSTGTIVKSRYLQPAEKTILSKSNSSNSESMPPPPKPASPKPRPKAATPPRRSVAPRALATSIMAKENSSSVLQKYVLQSTFSDGHSSCPDFDISAIKEKTVFENNTETERNPEKETFLLAYLTAKMQNNTAKLQAEAEKRIIQETEEVESMRLEVLEKKRQYEFKERSRLLNELLDLQIASMTPLTEAATQFTKVYKPFAAAVDITRHELSVKNFYTDGEQSDFLVKAESYLQDCENLLKECSHGNTEDSCISLKCLKNMKTASTDISQHLSGAFSELLELSSLIGNQTIHLQQASEEEKLGPSQTLNLFCPKK